MKYALFILVTFLFGFGNTLLSQETSSDTVKTKQLSLIIKNDGTEYIGVILSDDGREVLIETENLGKIYIIKSDIKSIKKIDGEENIVYGEYREAGPFTTRYSFTTNALPIKKGENYGLINLYGPEFHFALSDRFSLGVMTTWIASPLVIAGKYTFKTKNENVNVSLGSLIGTSGYLNNFQGYGGLHFGNLTIGSRSKNITFSAGFAHFFAGRRSFPSEGVEYTNDSYWNGTNSGTTISASVNGPVFSIAGIVKVGAKASFVFDSMVGVFSQPQYTRRSTTITEPVYDLEYPYEVLTPGYYRHEIIHYNQLTTALFVMPGMRFQKTEKMAFQVSLIGVSVFRLRNEYVSGNNFSFPVPVCMWFFKF